MAYLVSVALCPRWSCKLLHTRYRCLAFNSLLLSLSPSNVGRAQARSRRMRSQNVPAGSSHAQRVRRFGHLVPCHGTEVYFPSAQPLSSVMSEQFWGRAVRASRDSQESGALLNFVANQVAPIPRLDLKITDCIAEPEKIMPRPTPRTRCRANRGKCDQPPRPFAITSLRRRDKLVANER